MTKWKRSRDFEKSFGLSATLLLRNVHCSKLWCKFTSSVCTKADWSIRLLSIFRVAISLTITAHLKPSSECLVSRTCFSKVVFPAPRNPHNRDTGRRSSPDSLFPGGFVEVEGYRKKIGEMERKSWIGKKKINEISISFYRIGCGFSLFHVARDDILRHYFLRWKRKQISY